MSGPNEGPPIPNKLVMIHREGMQRDGTVWPADVVQALHGKVGFTTDDPPLMYSIEVKPGEDGLLEAWATVRTPRRVE